MLDRPAWRIVCAIYRAADKRLAVICVGVGGGKRRKGSQNDMKAIETF